MIPYMIDNSYKSIRKPNPIAVNLAQTSIPWRDAEPGIGRKVLCGAALAASGLCMVIDAIVSLALAIITSPLELCGVHLAMSFALRSFVHGYFGGLCLTFFQFDNIVERNLDKKISDRH